MKRIFSLFFIVFNLCFSNGYTTNDDILMVINYNHAHYGSAKFLKELYSPYCQNIIFFGDGNRGTVNVDGVEIQEVDTHWGYYLSNVMEKVFEDYPSFKGYLFLQDDCMLNYWNLSKLDKDKIWFAISFNDSKEEFYSVINLITNQTTIRPWGGWIDPYLENTKIAYRTLPKKYLYKVQKNLGPDIAVHQFCDMFYIPGKLSRKALELSYHFQNVHCEIAVAMMLCALEPIKKWERLSMRYGNPYLENYPCQLTWVHPIKLSNLDTRMKIKEIFLNADTLK